MRKIALLFIVVGLIGCNDYEKRTTTVETVRRPAGVVETTPPPAPAAVVVQPSLDDLIRNVQQAPDSPTEGEALRQLHGWLAAERMTYKVAVVRPDTGEVVQQPLLATIPVRADVSIFNKLQPFRDFGFLVKDNRNLTILGVQ
jgi:hypothetical protein